MRTSFNRIRQQIRTVTKPDILPMKTINSVEEFNQCDDQLYTDVVDFLTHIGGFDIRTALNLCMKEIMTDELSLSYSWWGNQLDRTLSFHSTKLVNAIQDAMANNEYFDPPTQAEFKAGMQEALRVAKQRYRNSQRRANLPAGDQRRRRG
ncbi:hypothetical protein DMN91_011924 [Ooceraea biroi]|uniref:Uncharacterized protein n=1 Tax=Ooceraea biroi TaxID=2015173 RepID=A0A3L8D7A7_OOCBI|nr:uncharacterized protein LOC105279452 [Ooceraea biroi]RLU16164.1 hypothetical protein DMN91_011924 [Ooceraea biroi]